MWYLLTKKRAARSSIETGSVRCPVRWMDDEAEFLPCPVKAGRKVTAAARAAQKLGREIEDAPLVWRIRLGLRPVDAALRYEHKIPRLEQILLALHAIARFAAKKFNDLVECVIVPVDGLFHRAAQMKQAEILMQIAALNVILFHGRTSFRTICH